MNPLNYGNTILSEPVSCDDKPQVPKTTAEKIGQKLYKRNEQFEQSKIYDYIYRVEREGGEAIRLLCEEIDSLQEQIANLSIKIED